MALRVVMPQLGESIVEATLVRWRVRPGESVERGQVLAEVETDKATNEVPAPAKGVVGNLLVDEGTTLPVGSPILEYAGAAQDASAKADAPKADAPKADAPKADAPKADAPKA